VEDLNRDLTAYAITEGPGWQRRILDQDPAAPAAPSFAAALAGPEPGIRARSSVRAWGLDHPARVTAIEWERAWLRAFEAWLAAHLARHGRRSLHGDRVAALAVTALVEGHLLLDRVWSHPGSDAWYSGRPDTLPHSIEVLLADLTEPDVDATEPESVPPPPPAELSPAARRALGRALEAMDTAAFGEPEAAAPGRLVDLAVLARRTGVSERRLYDVWPTASAANVDLVRGMGERALVAFDTLANLILDVGGSGPVYERYGTLSASGYQAYIETAVQPGRIHMFQCAHVLVDPAALDAFIDTTRRAAPSIRAIFLAMLSVTRKHRRPGVSAEDYLAQMRAAVGGVQRLAALDPALLEEEAGFDGGLRPICGLVAYRILEPLLTRDPPTGPAGLAPPLP
jgi:hypothetical protein